MDSLPDITAAEAEMETRLSLALLRNLPQTVRQPVVEGSTSKNVRCIISLHERYAPGGREELESIQRYLRQLPSAQDFKGAMTTFRRWKLARHRAQSLGLPEQAPNEGIAALEEFDVLELDVEVVAVIVVAVVTVTGGGDGEGEGDGSLPLSVTSRDSRETAKEAALPADISARLFPSRIPDAALALIVLHTCAVPQCERQGIVQTPSKNFQQS